MKLTVRLSSHKIIRLLFGISCVLAVLSLIMRLSTFLWQGEAPIWLRGLVWLFDVDKESNIPAFYNVALLNISSLLLLGLTWVKSRNRDRFTLHWGMIGGLFALMAWDEAVQLHETFVGIDREYHLFARIGLQTEGIFHFSWVIVGLALLVGVGVICLGLIRSLPRPVLQMFAKAAIVYLVGVLGMEMVGGVVASKFQESSLPYIICTHIEEFLEMAGLSLWIQALLRYLMRYVSSVKFYLGDHIAIYDLVQQPSVASVSAQVQHMAHPEVVLTPPLTKSDIS
jgi:hypothetical protein